MNSSKQPNFSIIIPNYNGAKFITPCLVSLYAAINNCPHSKFEIILVDNGSTDNSPQIFKKFFPLRSTLISLSANFGFAKAVNEGIRIAKYDYVCVLNNDLNLSPDWFLKISNEIERNPHTSTFCGTVLNRDGTLIESQGLRYFMSGRCENINNGTTFLTKTLKYQDSNNIIWGSSAAVVVYKKSALEEVGLFDESFFAYIEDVDLSYRLHHHHHQAVLVTTALSYHLGGSTSNSMGTLRQYYTLRNWVKLILKNYTIGELVKYFPLILIERLRNLSYLIRSLLKL